jgi:CTP synthase
MTDQKGLDRLGGTMRLGLYPCQLEEGTLARELYGREVIEERHRHRYEFNNAYKDTLQEHGLTFSGNSPDGKLVEIVEIKDHPYMIGTQFHPEFLSRPNRPHPLFLGLIKAACQQKGLPCEIISLGFKA